MTCSLQTDGSVIFQEIDPLLADLIITPFQQKELVFKSLAKQDSTLDADLKEYTFPELQASFITYHKQVLMDLAALQKQKSSDRFYTLTIAPSHRDAWLRMLSMVRLSLASHHRFTEKEFQANKLSSLTTPRGRALFQMEIFAVMQQCLIEAEESFFLQ